MESWLVPSITVTFIGTIILALALFYLHHLYHDGDLKLWSVGWGLYALRLLVEIYQSAVYQSNGLQAFHDIVNLFSALLLLWGALEMANQRIGRIWVVLAGLCIAWSLVAAAINLPFLLLTTPSFILVGIFYIFCGSTFLRHRQFIPRGRQVLGWSFILWGVHKFDYPLLRNVDWAAPWGFLLGVVLELVIIFAFYVVYLEKSLHEQRRLEQNALGREDLLRQSEERFRAVFEQAGVGVNISDDVSSRYIRVNQKLCNFLGYSAEELLKMDFTRVTHPDDLQADLDLMQQLKADKLHEFSLEKRFIRKDGSVVWGLLTATSLWRPGEPVSQHIAVIQDITLRKQAEAELKTRLSQQAAVAQLGQLALTTADLPGVLQAAVTLTAETLQIEFSKVLRLLPGGAQFQLVAATGWKGDLSENIFVSADTDTQAGYTLATAQAVIVEDLGSETRFHGSALLHDSNVTSGASVVIAGSPLPYGVLTAHSRQARRFGQSDIGFLQSIANVLSMAAQQETAALQLQRYVSELEILNRISNILRSAANLDEINEKLLDEVLSFFNIQSGSCAIFDQRQTVIEKIASRGWLAGPFPLTLSPDQGLLYAVKAAGGTLVIRDVAQAEWLRPEARPLIPSGWGGAAIPLRAGETIIGLLVIAVQLPRELAQAEIRLLETIAEMATIAIQRNRLYAQTRRSLAQMAALHEIDLQISSGRNLEATLTTILQHCIFQLEVEAAEIFQWNPQTQLLEMAASMGFKTGTPGLQTLRMGEGTAGQAALHQRYTSAHAPEFEREPSRFKEFYFAEGISLVCAAPVVSRGATTGVLQVYQRQWAPRSPDWIEYLETLAGQAAITMENLGLFEHLQRSNRELAQAYNETIEGWSRAMDLRDKETEGHTRRVTEMTVRVARQMGIAEKDIADYRRGALLHDIGKMGVPDEILQQTRRAGRRRMG